MPLHTFEPENVTVGDATLTEAQQHRHQASAAPDSALDEGSRDVVVDDVIDTRAQGAATRCRRRSKCTGRLCE